MRPIEEKIRTSQAIQICARRENEKDAILKFFSKLLTFTIKLLFHKIKKIYRLILLFEILNKIKCYIFFDSNVINSYARTFTPFFFKLDFARGAQNEPIAVRFTVLIFKKWFSREILYVQG